MNKLTHAASIVGVMVITGLVSTMVKIRVPFKYVQEIDGKEQIVEVQNARCNSSSITTSTIHSIYILFIKKEKIKHIFICFNNYNNCIYCYIF